MLTDPTPRPPRCYDPGTAPHREDGSVQVYDHRTIRGLLRDPHRVTSDVTEMLTPEQRDHLHPVSSFVWATDRKTISGCPGRHAALRSVMAPWFNPQEVADQLRAAQAACEGTRTEPGRPFDVYADYALPISKVATLKLGYAFEQDDFRFGNVGNTVDPASGIQVPEPARRAHRVKAPKRVAARSAKCSASSRMSSLRSRSGGSRIGKTASRYHRSSRNSFVRTMLAKSR